MFHHVAFQFRIITNIKDTALCVSYHLLNSRTQTEQSLELEWDCICGVSLWLADDKLLTTTSYNL